MQVRRSGAARAPGATDDLAALEALSYLNVKARQVRVVRRHAAAVIDDDDVAVAVIPADVLHDAAEAGTDRFAPARLDVAAGVKARAARERIAAITETAADLRRRNHRAGFILRFDFLGFGFH